MVEPTIYHLTKSIDKHFFTSVYKALTENSIVEFKPKIKQEFGVVYDLFGIEVPQEKMKYYLDKGYVEVSGDISIPACHICEDVCLRPLIVCPACSSTNIEKKDLMIHYDCNYVGPEEEFIYTESKMYKCPKCGKELKRVGIDYGRPGFGYICRDCGSIFQIPLVQLVCEKDHKNKIDELIIKKYPTYRLSDEMKKLVAIQDIVEEIGRKLAIRGLKIEVFKQVRGISGVTYVVPIFIKNRPSVIVELGFGEEIDERYLLSMMIEAADMPDSVMFLILPSNFKPELEKILNPEKIKIIKLDTLENSIDKVVHELVTLYGVVANNET